LAGTLGGLTGAVAELGRGASGGLTGAVAELGRCIGGLGRYIGN